MSRERGWYEVLTYVVLFAALAWAIYALLAVVLGWLWNAVLVDLFALPVIGFRQAFGLVLLLSLVGSFFKGSSKK